MLSIGYNLVPTRPGSATTDMLRDLFEDGYARSIPNHPLSFDQDVCPSSFEAFERYPRPA